MFERAANKSKIPIFSETLHLFPNASERIRMHPNASERIRTGPSRSEQVRKLQKTYANTRKRAKIREKFAKFFHGMLEEGIYLAPSQFEAGFVSAAHDEFAIEKTIAAATKVMRSL